MHVLNYIALTKPRVTMMVLLTTLVGFHLAGQRPIVWPLLLCTLAGTALAAGGTSALNMVLERKQDAQMYRTRGRPLPAGRLGPFPAMIFGVSAAVAGTVLLALTVNVLAGTICAVSMVNYVALYTPLKRFTWLSVMVGAVSGALPPMIGWAAARNDLSAGAWLLFAVLLLWQMPHFLSIGWLYREDYERAAFPILPVVDATGGRTARQAVLWTIVLVMVCLVPGGWGYRVASLALGLAFLAFAVRFAVVRSNATARQLLLASIAYLPLQLALLSSQAVV